MRSISAVAIFLLCFGLSGPALAVLPPEEQKKWHDAYLQSVDIEAEIELYEMAPGIKRQRAGRCEAYYTIGKISRQPQGMGLRSGDPLYLSYPCDNEGNWDWMGSTLPWAQAQADGRIKMRVPSRYLTAQWPHGQRIMNDPPVFAPVRPKDETVAVSGEDVALLADIDVSNGIDRDEANAIAREFFHRYVSACGRLGEAKEKGGSFEYPVYFGKRGKPGSDPVVIDKATGQVSMKEFSTPLDFSGIESEPPLEQIVQGCSTSGKEDILASEPWLQKERDVMIYCPLTDHYGVNMEKEDYPPEARTLASHQRFGACKYGIPATIFTVFTMERSAKKEACGEQQLADVRAGKLHEHQEIPVEEGPDAVPSRRFKLVSPHFAAVVYTTVYDIDEYDYWVDRSYEVLRQAERAAVDCLYLKK